MLEHRGLALKCCLMIIRAYVGGMDGSADLTSSFGGPRPLVQKQYPDCAIRDNCFLTLVPFILHLHPGNAALAPLFLASKYCLLSAAKHLRLPPLSSSVFSPSAYVALPSPFTFPFLTSILLCAAGLCNVLSPKGHPSSLGSVPFCYLLGSGGALLMLPLRGSYWNTNLPPLYWLTKTLACMLCL
jgi:hypothetical protein